MDDYYLIAEVLDIFSSDGSVIIKSFSDFSERFIELDKVCIDFFGKVKELDIEFTKENRKQFVVKFHRFNSEQDAQFLIGKKLYVSKENLFNTPEDTYYVHDLIGSDVYLDSLFFGKLVDVLKLPNNDVYVINKNDGKEILIPAVENFIKNINKNEKKIDLVPECKIFDEDEN